MPIGEFLKRHRRRLARVGLIVAGAGALLFLLLWAFGVRYLLFLDWMLPSNVPHPALDGGEVWTLDTNDGKVEAFFFPGAPASPGLIFAHGNGELIDHFLAHARFYRQQGFSVLLPEYRGYGRSEGTPSKQALTQDFVAFHDRFARHPSVDAQRIYLHGRSLGGAVVATLAQQRPVKGLILESTFTSVREIAADMGFPSMLAGGSFDTEAILNGSRLPVLLLHGKKDRVVPLRHAQKLSTILPHSTLVERDCGHNNCSLAQAEILDFIESTAP